MNNLHIRPATPADADAIFVLLTGFAVSYAPTRAAFNRQFPCLLAAPHAELLVAALSEQIVGYALAVQFPVLYANGPITELQELMVAPEHRGRGIGRQLVESVIAWARERESVEVTVPTRRAGSYYVKLGFEETAAYFKRKIQIEASG